MNRASYNFSERVRRMLSNAREEAHSSRLPFVAPEQILIAMAGESDGVAYAVLAPSGITAEKVRNRVRELAGDAPSASTVDLDLPYTDGAKQMLALAMESAGSFSHGYVGTEHMLLALLESDAGVASVVLKEFGIEREAATAQILKLLGP